MRILSRYVFREIVSSAMLGTMLATFVIFLQRSTSYFEMLVRSSTHTATVLWLFVLALPPVLPLTVPFGVLVGILIGLGRMSTDGEMIGHAGGGRIQPGGDRPGADVRFAGNDCHGEAALWLTPRRSGERENHQPVRPTS